MREGPPEREWLDAGARFRAIDLRGPIRRAPTPLQTPLSRRRHTAQQAQLAASQLNASPLHLLGQLLVRARRRANVVVLRIAAAAAAEHRRPRRLAFPLGTEHHVRAA